MKPNSPSLQKRKATLLGKLVRMLGPKADRSIAAWVGVDPIVVMAYRRVLNDGDAVGTSTASSAKASVRAGRQAKRGRKPRKYTKVDWDSPAIRALLASAKDEDLAKKLGVTDRHIRNKRNEFGIPAFRDAKWNPAIIRQLGTCPDKELAKKYGFTHFTVAYQRRKRGIPKFRTKGS